MVFEGLTEVTSKSSKMVSILISSEKNGKTTNPKEGDGGEYFSISHPCALLNTNERGFHHREGGYGNVCAFTSVNTSGRLPLSPSTWPTKRSARVSVGSTLVPTPMRPPGTANFRSFCSAYRDRILEKIGSHCQASKQNNTTTGNGDRIRSQIESTRIRLVVSIALPSFGN